MTRPLLVLPLLLGLMAGWTRAAPTRASCAAARAWCAPQPTDDCLAR